jgi:WD40 repeat protein
MATCVTGSSIPGANSNVLAGLGVGPIISFHGRPAHLGEEHGRVRLRDLATRAPIGAPIPITGEQPVTRAVVTRLADQDVVIDVRNRIRIWDLHTGRRLGTIPDVRSPGHREARAAVAQVRCTTLALSGAGPIVRVWDLRTGRELGPLTGHTGKIAHIRTGVIGDRPIAVTTAEDGTARVWNLTDGTPIGPPITVGRRYGVIELIYLNGHTLLIHAGRDERIRMWDLGG